MDEEFYSSSQNCERLKINELKKHKKFSENKKKKIKLD